MITFRHLLENLRKPYDVTHFKRSVSHITAVDSRDQSWQNNLIGSFAKYGFKPLGAGKYGSVYGNPSYPYIIKVFMKDTAYLKWLNWVIQNQDNPYVPKIKGKVVKIGKMFMAVRLEKLTPGGSVDDLYTADDAGDKHATKVVDFLEANNKLLDLHNGNVMLRGKQLVIIDPFYNWFKGGAHVMNPDDISDFKSLF